MYIIFGKSSDVPEPSGFGHYWKRKNPRSDPF
jgi:hypothetical protein